MSDWQPSKMVDPYKYAEHLIHPILYNFISKLANDESDLKYELQTLKFFLSLFSKIFEKCIL